MSSRDMVEQFLKFYDKFADSIFRHCYFRLSDREKARDLVQETFMKAWKYMADGGQVDNFRAFLYKVANNLIVDEYRKKKTESLDELQEQGFDVIDEKSRSAIELAEAERILKVINELEPIYREVITLRFVEDLTPKEIAQIVNESENVVSVRIHRGVKKLKELISYGQF